MKGARWSGSPSRSYKRVMSSWQDRYHAEVGAKHNQARTGPRRRRLDRAAWKAEQERLKAQKDAEIAVERATEARRLADEEEQRLEQAIQETVARRLQEAETVHAIATGGLIAAIRHTGPDPVRWKGWKHRGRWAHGHATTRIATARCIARWHPSSATGWRPLRQPPSGPGLLERLSGFLRGVTGWVTRLADGSPRWLKWPETVAYAANGAREAFRTPYPAMTLAGVIEDSPAWQSLTREAQARLDQAQAVQALTSPRGTRSGTPSNRGI